MLVSLRAQPPSCDRPQPGLGGKKSCIHPPPTGGWGAGRAGEWGMGLQGNQVGVTARAGQMDLLPRREKQRSQWLWHARLGLQVSQGSHCR